MRRLLPAELAELLELDLALDFFLVLAAPVVDAFAGCAGQFDQLVLRHNGDTITYRRIKIKG
jgi:hypothetical protein